MKRIIILLFILIMLTSCSQEVIIDENKKIKEKTTNSNCPFEEVNCEYPGNCGRYVDSDDNSICDNSE